VFLASIDLLRSETAPEFGGEACPHHIVGGGHALHDLATQIRMWLVGSEVDSLQPHLPPLPRISCLPYTSLPYARPRVTPGECYGGVERWETIRGAFPGAARADNTPPPPALPTQTTKGGGEVHARPSFLAVPHGEETKGTLCPPHTRPLGVVLSCSPNMCRGMQLKTAGD